ncbi:MAG TPA: VCBS repeat-containing protein, partial [Terriglobales bacterium]|nr:VCBS repeat-containing protein [Terriglobales bacterium]
MSRAGSPITYVSLGLLFLAVSARAQVTFFQPSTSYGGTGSLFTADFNGDGKPDLLSGSLVELGNGNGTFTAGVTVPGTPLAVADFNGDGTPDILEQGTGTLLVLLGNGNGTFQSPISTSSGANLSPIAAGNLTATSEADVVGAYNGSLYVYLSNGNGTFAAGVPYNLSLASGEYAVNIVLGDVNADGKTDVTVITQGGSTGAGRIIVFLGNGDGTLKTPPLTSTGAYASGGFQVSAVEATFNGGNFPDLVIDSQQGVCNPTCSIGYNISLLVGNGDGTFKAPTVAIAGVNGALAVADFNGDGNLDLAVEADPTVAEVYLGNGAGAFSNSSSYVLSLPGFPGMTIPSYMAVADFNLDGKPDIAAGNVVLLGNGNGTFQGVQLGISPDTAGPIAIGDFANNGIPYVAMLSSGVIDAQYVYSVDIFSNNGGGLLSLINTYPLQAAGSGIVAADLNGDGNLDLVVTSTDSTTQNWSYSVLLGNGNGSFQSPVFYAQGIVGNASSPPIIGDFNNDGKPDFAVQAGTQSVAVLLGNGDGTFANPVYYFDNGAAAIMAADFTGNGNLDIAAGSNGQTGILYGNGNGTFQPVVFPPSLNNFVARFTGDFNNDGKPDLFSGTQVALGNGNGTFTLETPISCPAGESCTAYTIGDLTGDGILDVLSWWGDQPEGTGVFLGNGNGTFGPLIDIAGYLGSRSAVIMDMNGDGKADIVFPMSVSYYVPSLVVNGVGVLLNTTPPNFVLLPSPLTPATVTAGNSATSTVAITPTFGFNSTVTLSCIGLPSAASCAFSPASIANASGTSNLTITTGSSTPAGTYSVKVQGTSGSLVNSATVSLVIQGPPDFALGPASGESTSQTITAGQSAKYNLMVTPAGSFTGTVNLSCSIKPAVTPAATCSLSSSSVKITGSSGQPVTVTVGTAAATATGTISDVDFPARWLAMAWMGGLFVSGWLWLRNRKRLPALAAPV